MQKNSTLQLLFPKVESAHLCHSGPSEVHTTHYLRGLWKVLLTQDKYLSSVTRLPPTGHMFSQIPHQGEESISEMSVTVSTSTVSAVSNVEQQRQR